MKDKKIEILISKENDRQLSHIELIASENFVSEDVAEATGSILTNKYAEGYPGKRYYSGCDVIDEIEQLAIERAKKIFNANYANVQSHSGSQANAAAYAALLKPGDSILGMSLNSGGHLTHGYHISSSGMFYNAHHYDVDPNTHKINYEEVRQIALKVNPKLIICGASAYSRIIDFKKFREIADEVGAYLLADIAHIAGLVIAGLHPSPIEHAHVITTTTHKTLRGPRGGMILTNNLEIAKKIDKAVFPCIQGGPLMHVIAAKAVAFKEADSEEFNNYQKQVIDNAKEMEEVFSNNGVIMTTGGTDNHLILINTKESFGITGDIAEALLFKAGIITNKNSIPFDEERPIVTSGIRVGTPAMTTKGFTTEWFKQIALLIIQILKANDSDFAESKRDIVKNLLEEI